MTWPTVALGEVAHINPRPARKPGDADEIAFVPMADLDGSTGRTSTGTVRPFGEVSKGYTIFQNADVLVAKITPCFENKKIGQARLARHIGVGSTEFHVVRPDDTALDARYLLYYLRQDWVRQQGERRMTGSAGQRRVPANFLTDLALPLPPLEEQRRIAAILDRVDSFRAARRRSLHLLGALARSAFSVVAKSADRVVELGSIITGGPTNGIYKPRSEYGAGVPIVRIDSFYSGEIVRLGGLKRVSVTASEQGRFALHVGDILINRVNSLDHLGKSALVRSVPEETVFESNMMRLRVDEEKLMPEFLIAWLQTADAKGQVRSVSKEAINQASINQKDVRSLVLPLPSMNRQRKFADQVRTMGHQRRLAETSGQWMDDVFASLQSTAFAGEL